MTLAVHFKLAASSEAKGLARSSGARARWEDTSATWHRQSQAKTNLRAWVCLGATGVSVQVQALNRQAFVCTCDRSLWSSGIPTGNFSYLAISEQRWLGNRDGKDEQKWAACAWPRAHWVNMPAPSHTDYFSKMNRECPTSFGIKMRKWLSAVHTKQNKTTNHCRAKGTSIQGRDFSPEYTFPFKNVYTAGISSTLGPGTF